MRLAEIMSPARVAVDLTARSKEDALDELAALFPEEDRGPCTAAQIASVLAEREAIASTGVGSGVAIPHGRIPALQGTVGALAVSTEGVDFDSLDGEPVFVFVCLLTPSEGGAAGASTHLRALASVSRVLKHDEVRSAIRAAKTKEEALRALLAADPR